jgi:hypothetical protein
MSHWAPQVLQLLLASCEGEEDVRGVVAECLGHTALLAPGPVLGMLRGRLGDASAAVRAAVAAAPRAMVVRSPSARFCLCDVQQTPPCPGPASMSAPEA